MQLTDEDFRERAAHRRRQSAYRIGVAIGRDLTEPSRWRAKVDRLAAGRYVRDPD
jgi:hypothetical protein